MIKSSLCSSGRPRRSAGDGTVLGSRHTATGMHEEMLQDVQELYQGSFTVS